MINAVTRLESFSNSHAECVTIFALGEIGAEIEFVFSADLESQAAAAGREKMIASCSAIHTVPIPSTKQRNSFSAPQQGERPDDFQENVGSTTLLTLSKNGARLTVYFSGFRCICQCVSRRI
jgi:hypothetical protein